MILIATKTKNQYSVYLAYIGEVNILVANCTPWSTKLSSNIQIFLLMILCFFHCEYIVQRRIVLTCGPTYSSLHPLPEIVNWWQNLHINASMGEWISMKSSVKHFHKPTFLSQPETIKKNTKTKPINIMRNKNYPIRLH